MKLLIYIPAFNEEQTIVEAIKSIPSEIEGVSSYDLLVVDDGSTDKTAQLAKEAGAQVISHGINRKLGVTFRTALSYAKENRYDILVSIDADRQFNAKQIPEIIKPIVQGEADMVVGNRFANGKPANMSTQKYWGNKQMSKLITFITKQKFIDVSCGFRAYSAEALLRLNLFGKFTYTQETILDMVLKEMRVVEVPVEVKYFKERKSRIAGSIFKYAISTSRIIFRTVRDYRPLFFFGGSGLLSILIAIAFLLTLFVHYMLSGMFTPYKFLGFISLGFFIWGALLFVIGLLADMLNRLRTNQERILYELNKANYRKKN